MRILLFSIVILCGSNFCSQAQAPGAADSLKAQASRMANGLISGDYGTFIHYLHPKVIEVSGGVAALKQTLVEMSRQLSTAGLSFQEVSLDSASAFIKKRGPAPGHDPATHHHKVAAGPVGGNVHLDRDVRRQRPPLEIR
jgi:hypothetical protein